MIRLEIWLEDFTFCFMIEVLLLNLKGTWGVDRELLDEKKEKVWQVGPLAVFVLELVAI